MPEYLYCNPSNENDIRIIYQSIHDKHEYSEKGIIFKRVWTIPQASHSTKVDPFDRMQFNRSLEGKHGETIGNTLDRSAELSEKRAERTGEDPIKKKYYDDFSKRHKGLSHPQQIKEQSAPQVAALKELGIKVTV